MSLFYCGNQWGYTPIGTVASVPTGFCNPPTNLKVSVDKQYATFSWTAPHDAAKFVLEYAVKDSGAWTPIDVFGQSYILTLPVGTFEWRVRTVCQAGVNESAPVAGTDAVISAVVGACVAVGAVTVIYQGTTYKFSWPATGAAMYFLDIYYLETGQLLGTYQTAVPELVLGNGIETGVKYYAQVRAFCGGNSWAPPSPKSEFTGANMVCTPPRSVTATKGTTSALVSWIPPADNPAANYNVFRNGEPVAQEYPGTSMAFADLQEDTEYTFEVRTACENGFSSPVSVTFRTDKAVCPDPSDLVISEVGPTGFKATWVPAPGVTGQQLIINSGEPIVLGAAITEYVVTDLQAGSNNRITVRSVCGPTNASVGISALVQLLGCAPITNLSATPSHNSLDIKWDGVANAIGYHLKVEDLDEGVTKYEQDVQGTRHLVENLNPASNHRISVNTRCFGLDSDIVTLMRLTMDIPPCETPSSYQVLQRTQDAITLQAAFASGSTGPFIFRLFHFQQTIEKEVATVSDPVTLTGLVADRVYDLYIYRKAGANMSCVPTAVGPYTHLSTCNKPTITSVSLTNNQQDLTVEGVAAAGANVTGYEIELQVFGTTTWLPKGNVVAFPHTLPAVTAGKYRVRLRTICTGPIQSDWVESGWTCPVPVLEEPAASGIKVMLRWAPLVGVSEYSVELVSTTGTSRTYSTTNTFIEIDNLGYGTAYGAKVRVANEVGGFCESNEVVFTTGAQPSCPLADFSVVIQDCSVTDPGGVNDQPGGGGSTPIESCSIDSIDWQLFGAPVFAPANDGVNNTFLEVSFYITQFNEVSGDPSFFPGGALGQIVQEACRPNAAAILEVEIVTGGELMIGEGVLDTSGYITLSGTYLPSGGRLIVRLRGNYNKV